MPISNKKVMLALGVLRGLNINIINLDRGPKKLVRRGR